MFSLKSTKTLLFHFYWVLVALRNVAKNEALSLLSSTPFYNVNKVVKVPAAEFDVHKHYFHKRERRATTTTTSSDKNDKQQHAYYETPVLVENALSASLSEEICDSIVYHLGHASVDLQRKHKGQEDTKSNGGAKEQTQIYNVPLSEALALIMDSKHHDSLFCFSEGLLDSVVDNEEGQKEMEAIKEIFTSTREKMFCDHGFEGDDDDDDEGELDLPSDLDSSNLFDFFPSSVRPSDCVVIAGEGATSTLHRDPFCWTGTSLCLEGTKVWRFVAPPFALSSNNLDTGSTSASDDSGVSHIDNVLDSYRLPSVAWNNDNGNSEERFLSSGWQSDYSLYSSLNLHTSAEAFASMDEDEKISIIEEIAGDLEDLSPNCPKCYPTVDDGNDSLSIWTVVQKPGDLLIIPAFWWHQTYAFEPSMAIASQRCGRERDCKRVLKHIAETAGLAETLGDFPSAIIEDEYIKNNSMENIAEKLFALLSINQK